MGFDDWLDSTVILGTYPELASQRQALRQVWEASQAELNQTVSKLAGEIDRLLQKVESLYQQCSVAEESLAECRRENEQLWDVVLAAREYRIAEQAYQNTTFTNHHELNVCTRAHDSAKERLLQSIAKFDGGKVVGT